MRSASGATNAHSYSPAAPGFARHWYTCTPVAASVTSFFSPAPALRFAGTSTGADAQPANATAMPSPANQRACMGILLSLRGLDPLDAAHVGHERPGDRHRAVGILVVLEH